MDDGGVIEPGRNPGEAWLMSTPMIKGELQALLVELVPSKRWPKSTRLKDLCDFAVQQFASDTHYAKEQRALELARVLRDSERR
jgi:hypothetical protein